MCFLDRLSDAGWEVLLEIYLHKIEKLLPPPPPASFNGPLASKKLLAEVNYLLGFI